LDAGRLLVNAPPLDTVGELLALINGLAEQIEDAPERDLADGDSDRRSGVDDLEAAREAVGRVHRDRAHAIVTEVLLDLAHEHSLAGDRAHPGLLLLG